MHGATPLHILCARGPQLKPTAAADLVAAVATPATVSRPADAATTPAAAALKRALPLHEATPLELASAAAGDDPALLLALLDAGAEVAGEGGTRALMVALTHGKLARARVLLQGEVRGRSASVLNPNRLAAANPTQRELYRVYAVIWSSCGVVSGV